MRLLVTGAAGFIGSHLAERLCADGHEVLGVDAFVGDDPLGIRAERIRRLGALPRFTLERADLAEPGVALSLLGGSRVDAIVHLAGAVGVRGSSEHRAPYLRNNIAAFVHLGAAASSSAVGHLIFASSSSVYGRTGKVPFKESDPLGAPSSFYASSKRANEAAAEALATSGGLRATGLRLFTVYGPRGRPDMAPLLFARRVLRGEPVELRAEGQMHRDFTFIDDVVEVLVRAVERPPLTGPSFRLLNVGTGKPRSVRELLATIEDVSGLRAEVRPVPGSSEELDLTWADVSELKRTLDFTPSVPLREGITALVAWLRQRG